MLGTASASGNIHIYCDGAARGNPGPAALGVVAFAHGRPVKLSDFKENPECSLFYCAEFLGHATNNEAEYQAIIRALEECRRRNIHLPVLCSDSELVIRQLQGKYRVREPRLKKFFEHVKALLAELSATVKHIPREKNTIADFLANSALDQKHHGRK